MKQKIIHLATLTLIGFPFIGWLILWIVNGPPFLSLFLIDQPLILQLSIGIATGVVAGWIAWVIIRSPLMKKVRNQYGDVIRAFNLSPAQILYISLCAGIGEEILFRGVIQPYLGIWVTSIFFVAIHGYLNPFNWRLFLYGLYMTAVILWVSFIAEQFGLYSAIAAHVVIDIILLHQLSKKLVHETLEPENRLTGENGP